MIWLFLLELLVSCNNNFTYTFSYRIDISIFLNYNESALSRGLILCEKEKSLEKCLMEEIEKRYGWSIGIVKSTL